MIITKAIPLHDYDRFRVVLDKAEAKVIETRELEGIVWVDYTIHPLAEKILVSRFNNPCWVEESIIKPIVKKAGELYEVIARYTIDIVIHLLRKL